MTSSLSELRDVDIVFNGNKENILKYSKKTRTECSLSKINFTETIFARITIVQHDSYSSTLVTRVCHSLTSHPRCYMPEAVFVRTFDQFQRKLIFLIPFLFLRDS